MLEQTLPTPLEHNDQSAQSDVLLTVSESLGYNMESTRAKQEAWQNNGECPGPDEIGRIELSEAALAHLKDNLPEKYLDVASYGQLLISEDDEVAADEARRENLSSPIDARSREILRGVTSAFEKILRQDSLQSDNQIPNQNPESFFHFNLLVGNGYMGTDVPHIDDGEDDEPGDVKNIRYLVTISGPATTFYVGNGLDISKFNEEGDIIGKLPESIDSELCETGQVVRFLDRGDPHCAPTAPDPVFRIFIAGTVKAS